MTLEQFVKPIDGHATFTIYKDGQPFLYVKDLEVTCWNVAGFGYGDALTIIFLKSAEKEETPEAATSGISGK